MKYLTFLLVPLIASAVFAAPSRKTESSLKESRSPTKYEIQPRSESSPGMVDVLQALIGLLTNFLGVLDGQSSIEDLVGAIQNIFFTFEKMVNVQWVVSQIPFVGSYLAPMVGGVGTILEDSGMLGGLISQVLVGPTYPKSVPTPPPTPPRKSGSSKRGGLFGGWL